MVAGLTVEWSVTVGNILSTGITILGFTIAAFGYFLALQRSMDRTGEHITVLADKLDKLDRTVVELSKVVTGQAILDTKVASLQERMNRQMAEITDANHWLRDRLDWIEHGKTHDRPK